MKPFLDKHLFYLALIEEIFADISLILATILYFFHIFSFNNVTAKVTLGLN